jgi:hypothetical protein
MIRFLWNSVMRAFGYIIDNRRLSLTVFVIAFVTVQSFLNTSFITADYFRKFKVGPATAFDSDYRKLLSSNLPIANIIELLRRENTTGAITLVFRQAGFGYYSGLPFVYVYDNSYADLFRTHTPEELYQSLREKKIKYLLTPDYSMPEFYNSGFANFVADLRFSELIYEQKGYKLTQIRDTPITAAEQTTVVSADFSQDPQDMDKWQLGRQPSSILKQLSTDDAKLIFNKQAGYVELLRKKKYKARPFVVDVMQPNPLRPRASPFLIGRSDFNPVGKIFNVEADIEGRGYFELVVAEHSRVNMEEKYDEAVIWSGVLDGERRTVRGRFTDLLVRGNAETLLDDERRFRVYLRLIDGSDLRLHSWQVRSLSADSPALGIAARYQAALDLGWDFGNRIEDNSNNKNNDRADDRQARLLYFGIVADDTTPGDGTESPWVRVSQFDSAVVQVYSPLYYVPPSIYHDLDDASTLDTIARNIYPAITTSYELSGHGALSMTAFVYCHNPYSILQDNRKKRKKDKKLNNELLTYNLGSRIILDRTRVDETQFTSKCIPSFVRYFLEVKRNRFLAKYDTSLSNIRFRNFKTRLSYATPDQQIRTVELIPVTRLVAKK